MYRECTAVLEPSGCQPAPSLASSAGQAGGHDTKEGPKSGPTEGKDDMAKSRSWVRLWVALAASVGLLLLAPSARAVVLYDQTNSPEGLVSSQDFESGTSRPPLPPTPTASYNAFDTTVADDFTVPSGESWTIHWVDALGNLIPLDWSDPASVGITPASRVKIYRASGTLPGASVFTSTSIRHGDRGIEADLALPVRGAPALPPGHYWVSVQAIKDFNPLGQWSWTETAVQSGDPSVFENPGNGFGTSCTTFMPKRAQCIPGARLDQAFSLSGTVGSPAVPPPAPEPQQSPPPEGGPPLPAGAPVPIVGSPPNEFGFGKVKKNKKKGTAKLTVKARGPGELELAKTKNIKPDQGLAEGGSFIQAAGKKPVSIKPRGNAKKKLNTKGKATVKAKVTYTPVMLDNVGSELGDPNTESKKIKLIKR
jgi:hypothetical protein